MSGVKDTFEILADEITLIRREIDQLQRSSLNKDEAKVLNASIVEGLNRMAQTGPAMQRAVERRLDDAALAIERKAFSAAQLAIQDAMAQSHVESLKAAQNLSQAAGEARRQAWRYFGGFWVWLTSVGATGALMGALAVFWLQGRADASAFGKHPGIYCERAGGTVVTNTEGRKFCGVWIDPLPQQAGE